MVFRGRGALPSVQTGDWDIPFAEPPDTRAADAYKLGLLILRLFARSHDARAPAPHLRYVPVELRDLLYRSLGEAGVNRPTAGEWQRALHGLLADGGLDERYPGPTPAPRVGVAGAAAPPAGVPRVRHTPAPPWWPRRPLPAAAPAAGQWLQRSVVVLWILAGSIVLLLVLSRLFAAAVPVPDPGAGSPAGAGAGPYYYSPGYYPGGRAGRGFIQVPLTIRGRVLYGELTSCAVGSRPRRMCASSHAEGLPEPRSWGPAAAPGCDSHPGPPAGPRCPISMRRCESG